MRKRYIVAGAVIIAITSAAVGRYTAPVKVKVETKTVTVVQRRKDVVKTEIVKPDGTRETVTKSVTDTNKNVLVDQKSETTKDSQHVNVYLLGGGKNQAPVFGGHVSAEVLGPLSIGLFGLSDGAFGASLGMRF